MIVSSISWEDATPRARGSCRAYVVGGAWVCPFFLRTSSQAAALEVAQGGGGGGQLSGEGLLSLAATPGVDRYLAHHYHTTRYIEQSIGTLFPFLSDDH